MLDVNISHQVVLERPELPDLSKSGPPEPMDDTPPSPQVMRAIILHVMISNPLPHHVANY